ncbi:MAG: hypothetical protein ACFFB2_18380 [Promethearchaeota archaeon]
MKELKLKLILGKQEDRAHLQTERGYSSYLRELQKNDDHFSFNPCDFPLLLLKLGQRLKYSLQWLFDLIWIDAHLRDLPSSLYEIY